METETTSDEQASIKQLLEDNKQLLEENRELLKKVHRNALIGFWFRVFSVMVLIGLPFALYFYVLEPYFAAMGSSYETFINGLNELPGLRGIEQLLDKSASE